MALPEIVARLAAGAPLPERKVAITIDDAALSVYREAWPRLKAAKLPFPLFVSPEPLDRGLTGSISCAQTPQPAAAPPVPYAPPPTEREQQQGRGCQKW